MFEELAKLVLNNRLLMSIILGVLFLLVLLLLYWVYAEILIYLKAKKQEIEKMRNKMDGIEMGLRDRRRHERRRPSDGTSVGGQVTKTINFGDLDKAGERKIKYSQISIIKEEPDSGAE